MLLASGSAWSTQYTISDLSDALSDSDGKCTLREAIKASVTNKSTDDCEAGTGSNVITLPELVDSDNDGIDNTDKYVLSGLVPMPMDIGGAYTDIVEYGGDPGDHTETFMVLVGIDVDTADPTDFLPYTVDPITRESDEGMDLNDDGDTSDSLVLEDEDALLDVNGDGDYLDRFNIVTEAEAKEIVVSITIQVELNGALDT